MVMNRKHHRFMREMRKHPHVWGPTKDPGWSQCKKCEYVIENQFKFAASPCKEVPTHAR